MRKCVYLHVHVSSPLIFDNYLLEDKPPEIEVEEGVEAKEPPPTDVVQLCRETFQKTAEYLHGELEGTI